MLAKPAGGSAGGAVEIRDIGVEMSAGEHDEPFRFERALVGGERRVGDREVIPERQDHEERRRADEAQIGAGLVLRSAERRVGNGGGCTCRSRLSPYHYNKTNRNTPIDT